MQGSSDCDRERDRELDFGGIINSVLVPPLLNIALPLSRATTASNATALHPRRISPASNRAAEQTLAPPPVGLEDDASRAATLAAPPSSNRPSELRAKGRRISTHRPCCSPAPSSHGGLLPVKLAAARRRGPETHTPRNSLTSPLSATPWAVPRLTLPAMPDSGARGYQSLA